MSTVTLPSTLRNRIARVGRRVRLLRAVRGLSLLVLVLALGACAATGADLLLGLTLPPAVRAANLGAWAGLGALTLLFALVVPLSRRLRREDLAAAVEQHYPELGERLTSSVELAGRSDPGSGSPALIRLLVEDTDSRTRTLDFRPAAPGRAAGVCACLAALGLGLLAAPASLYPDEARQLAERFVFPWRVPPPPPDFTFAVHPGDTAAARGRPLTLVAELTPRDAGVERPNAASLVILAPHGEETRLEMMARSPDSPAYTLAYNVPGDFRYRVEAGNAASETYSVTAVTPVELAENSPAITVTPPEYARATTETQTRKGMGDLLALEHSTLTFAFRFTRPAVAARLEWKAPQGKGGRDGTRTHPLTLSADRRAGTLTVPAAPGAYRVVLEAEHQVLTERDGGNVTLKPDQPPVLLKFAGSQDLRAVRPSDSVPLEVRLADDVAVAQAHLLYRVNADKEVHEEPITLRGAGTKEAVGRLLWQLAGKVKQGDEVSYRVRFRDNLPRAFKGPHTVYYPGDSWLRLKVVDSAAPLRQQEITAQRDDVNRRLEAIKADLLREQRGVYKVQQESREQDDLSPDHREQLGQMRRLNRTTETALRNLARETSATPELAPLSEALGDVADKEMRRADSALRDAGREGRAAPQRHRDFEKADREVAEAIRKVDRLRQANDRLAKERLDQLKVQQLADREKALAEKVAELAARHPVLDPKARDLAEQIKREQAEAKAELERLANESEPLRKALEEARAEEARGVAEKARELARDQRDLARAIDESERRRDADRLGELARRQRELAEKARRLAGETARPARAARKPPLRPEQAEKAAEALNKGEADRAVRHQDQSARDLERLAHDLDQAAARSLDPRAAARQLARLQDDLAARVMKELSPRGGGRPLAERMAPLKSEQEAIERAAEGLSVPPQDKNSRQLKKLASEEAARAAEAMGKPNPREALAPMGRTKDALRRLGEALPDLNARRQNALGELARLRQRQEEVARKAEEALRAAGTDSERKLEEAARKQAELAEALAKLDAPNQEARKEKTRDALHRALDDLLEGRKKKLAASQADAKRRLERLEQAVAGGKPADEKAAELARRQKELAEEAKASAGKAPPQKVNELRRKQDEIARETHDLQAPEASRRKDEAEKATRAAQQAARANPASGESAKAMEEAARKLGELARQMAGGEKGAAPKPADSRRLARELARRQKELAKATRDAARAPAGKDELERLRRRQKELNEQARRLPAEQSPKGVQQARSAMRAAEDALGRKDAAEAGRKQAEAGAALERLARAPASPRRTPPDSGRATPPSLPTKEQAEKARRLAREQRELQDAVRRAAQAARAEAPPAGDNPVAELARKQDEIARAASKLAGDVGKEEGPKGGPTRQAERAGRSAAEAARRMQAGELGRAHRAGKSTAEQMRRLARELAQTPRGKSEPGAPDVLQTARRLARAQEELNRRTAPLAANTEAGRAQRQARQAELVRRAGELGDELQRLGERMNTTPGSAVNAYQAANSARQAQNFMQQAQNQDRAGQRGPARQARDQAAGALARAAAQAEQAGRGRPGEPGARPGDATARRAAGRAMARARGEMERAQGRMGQAQPRGARQSMEQAAGALQEAARQLARAMRPSDRPGRPTGVGRTPSGRPDPKAPPAPGGKLDPRRWGELPGELRTKLMQDVRASFGEDYTPTIKLYFEQMADTRKKK